MAETYTTKEGDMVDRVALTLRGETAEVTEQIYTLNPGLAALGPTLPAGVVITLPDPPAKKVTSSAPRIWS